MNAQRITIQTTNNDEIIKFVSDQILINGGSYEFNNIDEAKNSPLAHQFLIVEFDHLNLSFVIPHKYDQAQALHDVFHTSLYKQTQDF